MQEKIDYFNSNITKNIDSLIPFYNHRFIAFCQLTTLIYENLNCLLLGLNQASIFTTNHLLERMLKVALIEFHTKGYYIGNPEFEAKLEEAKEQYDGALLNNTITSAFKKNIIVEDEKNELMVLKNNFRNPYSHAQMNSIIKNVPPTFSGFMFNFKDGKDFLRSGEKFEGKAETVSSYVVGQHHQFEIAKTKAFEYFNKVFNIMKSIDERYQSKS